LAKRVVERLQSFFLQVDVPQIVIHKADQPNAFFGLFDTDCLTTEDGAEINFLRCRQIATVSDLVARGGSVDFRGALAGKR
jgi:hypothetical protein